MEASDLIRRARKRSGLSQQELAERAATSQPVISAYERGLRDPSTHTLRRIIAATGNKLELRLADRVPDIPPPANRHEHALRLVDVLLLSDAVAKRRTIGELRFPRINSQ